MKQIQAVLISMLFFLFSLASRAQQVVATNTNVVVPPLVNFSGTLADPNGKPITGSAAVTFSLYSEQTGGAALWMETQNVQPDTHGHYNVTLGSTSSTGLPADIFVAGQAHWLGVQVEGEAFEKPRVLLLSVPYALKAGDAQTLGGMPASAFVLAAAPTSGASTATPDSGATTTNAGVTPATSSDVTTSGGTINALPLFSTATNIQNSLLTQTGTSAINVAGKLNLPATGTATASVAFNSRPLDFVASEYNSSTNAAVAETFQWQAQPASNDTSSPAASLNLLYGLGTNAPAQTGLRIASNGLITFAPGQTFVGTGSAAGYGVEGEGPNIGVYGTSTDGIGVEGSTSNGVAGMFVLNSTEGKLMEGTTNGVTEFTVDYKGDITTGGTINASSIVGTGPNATSVGVEGISTGASGYGVEGTSPNVGVYGGGSYGVDGHGTVAGVKGVATASGGLSGLFQGGRSTWPGITMLC
jgi:trimeric autotransporter adhesin